MSNRRADELKPGDKITRGALKGGTVVWATPHNRVFVDAGRAGSMTVTPDFEFAIEDPTIYEPGDIVRRKVNDPATGSEAVLIARRDNGTSWDVVVTKVQGRVYSKKGDATHWGEQFFEHVPAPELELRVGARVRRMKGGLAGVGGQSSRTGIYAEGLEGTVVKVLRGGSAAEVQLPHRLSNVDWDACYFEVVG